MLDVPGEDVVGADDYQAQMRFVVDELLAVLILLIRRRRASISNTHALSRSHATSLRGKVLAAYRGHLEAAGRYVYARVSTNWWTGRLSRWT